jgi:tRNA A-37 threonylcarbamoyl transferase component Bud32
MQTTEATFLGKLGYSQVKVIKHLPSFTRQVSLCSAKKGKKQYLVVKYHKYNLRRIVTDSVICGLSIAIFRPIKAYVSVTERIRGELIAREVLKKVNIETSTLIYPERMEQLSRFGYFIVEEYVESVPLSQFALRAEPKILWSVGYSMGVKTASLHKLQYAFGDNRASNTLIEQHGSEITFYKVDHEYFCWDPSNVFQMLDIIMLTQYPGIPDSFVNGFFKGYNDAEGFETLEVKPEYFERATHLFGDLLSIPLHFIKQFE